MKRGIPATSAVAGIRIARAKKAAFSYSRTVTSHALTLKPASSDENPKTPPAARCQCIAHYRCDTSPVYSPFRMHMHPGQGITAAVIHVKHPERCPRRAQESTDQYAEPALAEELADRAAPARCATMKRIPVGRAAPSRPPAIPASIQHLRLSRPKPAAARAKHNGSA